MPRHTLAIAATLLLAAAAAQAHHAVRVALPAPDVPVSIDDASLAELEAWYLGCDLVTRERRVDQGLMDRCVRVGDALLQRGFDGDFDRLLAWWRSHRSPPAIAGL